MYDVVGLNEKAKEMVSNLQHLPGEKFFDGNLQPHSLRVFCNSDGEVIFSEIVQEAKKGKIHLTLQTPEGVTPPEALWRFN